MAAPNPFLLADGLLDFAAVAALQKEILEEVKNEDPPPKKPRKPASMWLIQRKAKPAPFSAKLEKAGDLKYTQNRAIKLMPRKRTSEAGLIRNAIFLTDYSHIEGKLGQRLDKAIEAVNKHIPRALKQQEALKTKKAKIRDVKNAQFAKDIDEMTDILVDAGIKESSIAIGTSMFGKVMLVKLPSGNVLSISKADMERFKAAQNSDGEAKPSFPAKKTAPATKAPAKAAKAPAKPEAKRAAPAPAAKRVPPTVSRRTSR